MEFSQWLQKEMDKRQLTNYRLAKLSGAHQTTIANLLDGKKPQIETERKIREAISRMDYEKEKSPSITGGGNTNQYCVQFRLFYCTAGRNPAARSFASNPPPR